MIKSWAQNTPRGCGRRLFTLLTALLFGAGAVGCGSPQIGYYQPEMVTKQAARADVSRSEVVLGVEDFSTSAAYDEQRMVYRTGPHRFDYYHYHRWAAPPGMLVAELLRKVYQETGAFQTVVGGYATQADAVLGGRVTALEEVDAAEDKWLGRITVDMRLRDAVTGELLWSEKFTRETELEEQSPAGLAAALSSAITEIGVETAGELAKVAQRAIDQRPGNKPMDLKKMPGDRGPAEEQKQKEEPAGEDQP